MLHFVKSYGIIKKSREKGEFSVDEETDVISMDFPEYKETVSPFPDVNVVPTDIEEAYRKNIDIAKKTRLAERKEVKAAERKQKREHKRSNPKISKSRKTLLILAAVYLVLIIPVILGCLLFLLGMLIVLFD